MIGVVLLNLGGPDSLEAVRPFLYNLFSDRDIIRLGPSFLQKPLASLIAGRRSKKLIGMYEMIGGKSPILDITIAQAKALESSLNPLPLSKPAQTETPPPSFRKGAKGEADGFKVYVGMRYWHPFIEETVDKTQRDGVSRILALSLYPHYSVATSGSSIKIFEEVVKKYHVDFLSVSSWSNHPLYINALADRIHNGIKGFDGKPMVLFSAHGLPQKIIDEGDPYVNEIQGTINGILKKMDIQWRLSYQSRAGRAKWLGPSTEQMIHDLADEGVKDLLVVPISFVSDHIETLYEIDILYKNMAVELGINLKRTESLNTSPRFITALKDIVMTNVKEAGWR